MPRYITTVNTFDRSAIMRAAWSEARTQSRAVSNAPAPFRRITTARAEFGQALARIWGLAKSERAYAIWAAEQQVGAAAETARRTTLPARVRAIEDARYALLVAEHADSFTVANNVAVSAARARLRLMQEAH